MEASNLKELHRVGAYPTYPSSITDIPATDPVSWEQSIVPIGDALTELLDVADSKYKLSTVLKGNITTLQDLFLENLYHFFQAEKIDYSQKIALRLNQDGILEVFGQHPDKKQVNTLLAKQVGMAHCFAEIARQASILKNMHSLRELARCNLTVTSIALTSLPEETLLYQTSLKGVMNHFFFVS